MARLRATSEEMARLRATSEEMARQEGLVRRGAARSSPRRQRSFAFDCSRPLSCQTSLARQEGLEPPTYCLEGSCSIQLSYWRVSNGAGDGNRTRVSSLEGWCSTIELHPQSPDLTDSARAFYHIIFLLSRGQFRIFRFCRKKNRLQTEPVPELTWRIPQPWFPESH